MIKLKDLIDVNNMKYSNEVKPKHQKSMDTKAEFMSSDMKVPKTPFPENSSRETRRELEHLLYYNGGSIDDKIVKEGDDLEKVFENYCKDNNLKYNKDYYEQIKKDSSRTILKLKYYYNRPRPFQLAEFYDIKEFKDYGLPSMKTPSYPSGHTTQAYLFAELLGREYPKHYEQFIELAEFISESRIMARAHYPSDLKFGQKVAQCLVSKVIEGNKND
tara:strand:+ start:1253 stop:1903 length:651 start_codon:yes stop_codon:yes gene_type:complete